MNTLLIALFLKFAANIDFAIIVCSFLQDPAQFPEPKHSLVGVIFDSLPFFLVLGIRVILLCLDSKQQDAD
jgi:hypothetical protein